MMIYVLLAGLILEFIYSYYVFNRNLFSPSAVISEVFILSVLACICNIDNWGVDLSPLTVGVILGGNAVFILMATLVHLFYKRKNENTATLKFSEKMHYIAIKRPMLVTIFIIYMLFSIIFIMMSLTEIGNFAQGDDFSSAMSVYRDETLKEGSSLSSILTNIGVILNIGTFVLAYIFINNFMIDRKKIENYLLLASIIMYLLTSIFTAQRTTILLMFIYVLFVVYSLLMRKNRTIIKKMNLKYIRRGIIAVLVFLTLFAVTRFFFGRHDRRTAMDSVTYYMGNSIESLDLYIEGPLKCNQFGEELFQQFRVTLSKFGLVQESTMTTRHLEFRKDAKGNSAGNIYTAYRYYIHDFGYGSIVIFQILLGLFYSIWYEKIFMRKMKNGIDLSFILYAWFMLVLFRFSLMNSFFTSMSYFVFTHWYVFLAWKIFMSLGIKKPTAKGIEVNNESYVRG